ncbi:MAG: phage Gp37/Gp68 family protein [Beijerinckiaceae bacterium]|nr:phage Gp37/Gp68 family protein [Beijerinckiaceae bacterium]
MADATKIEWTDATWNPITGCSVVSPGCTNCYAMKLAGTRLAHHPSRAGLTRDTKAGPVWNGTLRFNEEWLTQPLHWKRPRMVFVCAHGDLFHEDVPDEWIDMVFAVMALSPLHTFQVLTKRAERMRAYISGIDLDERDDQSQRMTRAVNRVMRIGNTGWGICGSTGTHITTRLSRSGAMEAQMLRSTPDGGVERLVTWTANEERWHRCGQPFADRIHAAWGNLPYPRDFGWGLKMWPLPNVWLGISAEDQSRWDARVSELRATPAAVRFVSAEPLLGPIEDEMNDLDWIIVGGENGPRPMEAEWAQSIRDRCEAAGTAFFFKQWGSHIPAGQTMANGKVWAPGCGTRLRATKGITGRLLDGVEHNAMPRAA